MLKKHLFNNPDILTKSEKALPFGAGTAVVGDIDQEKLAHDIMQMSFISRHPEKFHPQVLLKESLSKTRQSSRDASADRNLWDYSHFSSINN